MVSDVNGLSRSTNNYDLCDLCVFALNKGLTNPAVYAVNI